MWLVLGLGNPGKRYADTRHNVGFLTAQTTARRWGISLHREQAGAVFGDGTFRDQRVILAMPQLFMNRSGLPGESLRSWNKVALEQVLVVHDDMDLPFGEMRIKVGGGHGGHNGLRDLDQHMGPGFVRLRMGISRPPPEWDPADYVLSSWRTEERELVGGVVERAVDALEIILIEGPMAAMNRFNTRPKRARPSEPSSGGAPV